MGVLPLQFKDGESAAACKLTGRERFDVLGVGDGLSPRGNVKVRATAEDGSVREVTAIVRIDTPEELVAFRNGGILPYVLRQLLRQ
jgi:aconitate hydratase